MRSSSGGGVSSISPRNFQLRFLRPVLGREAVLVSVRSGRVGDLLQDLEAHALDVVLTNFVPSRNSATPEDDANG